MLILSSIFASAKSFQISRLSFIVISVALSAFPCSAQWTPAKGALMTRWAAQVTPETAHREYPRPQMVRDKWLNLNGLWDYAIQGRNDQRPAAYEGQILVPFPVESALSGVMRQPGPDNRLWYHRSFESPRGWSNQRVMLHFGAVDWETMVWGNGRKVGEHRGGYDRF